MPQVKKKNDNYFTDISALFGKQTLHEMEPETCGKNIVPRPASALGASHKRTF